jgi:uncharacterized membrane protein YebE (DUF533 family)
MRKPQSQSRAQRRAYEAFLKKTNPAAYKQWKSEAIERGNQIHEANAEAVRKAEEEHYEKLQTSLIASMRADGKTDAEIDEFIADWVQTIKLWGVEERPKRWREIRREKIANA